MRTPVYAALLVLSLSVLSTAQEPPEDPLQGPLTTLTGSLDGIAKLAVIDVEATGTAEDMSGLEKALLQAVGAKPGLAVVPPPEVRAQVGIEWAATPEGVASVATRTGADAALFPRLVRSTEGLELNLLVVQKDGKVRLDEVFRIKAVPPGETRAGGPGPQSQPPTETASPQPPPEALSPQPPSEEQPQPPTGEFDRRRLSIGSRSATVVGGGGAVMFGGGHFGVSVGTPMVAHVHNWLILEGNEKPVSELQLAKLTGREDLVQRIEEEISSLRLIRNVGIGMTLGGFIAAGAAFPLFKSEDDTGITLGGVLVGAGLAVGVSGLVLWLIYGPRADLAEGPFPAEHLLSKPEAEQLIDAYNDALRRELGLTQPEATLAPADAPTFRIAVIPAPGGGAATFGFSF